MPGLARVWNRLCTYSFIPEEVKPGNSAEICVVKGRRVQLEFGSHDFVYKLSLTVEGQTRPGESVGHEQQ